MTTVHWTNDVMNFIWTIFEDGVDHLGDESAEKIFADDNWRTIQMLTRRAREKGKKVCIVVYDDGEPESGPLYSDVFLECWKALGSPKDRFQLEIALQELLLLRTFAAGHGLLRSIPEGPEPTLTFSASPDSVTATPISPFLHWRTTTEDYNGGSPVYNKEDDSLLRKGEGDG